MASAFAAKMGFNSLMRKQAKTFNVRISTMESDLEFSCEVRLILNPFSLSRDFSTFVVTVATTPGTANND